MKYLEVVFTITAPVGQADDARDLLAAMAGAAGFETFDETAEGGLTGYVQQQLFDEDELRSQLAQFPFSEVTISYTVGEAENRDWNEQWEQAGFEPIVVADRIVIHDGRHLPPTLQSSTPGSQLAPIAIEIDARQAFGTGTHETTRMVVATLLTLDMHRRRVLDCGCGTGILAICALKLGARECVTYDIDEWSTDNTRHNAIINHVELEPLLGDASILNKVEGVFDVVMANINRNILLADMPRFREKLAAGGVLVLSGFYTADVPPLVERASGLGLTLKGQRAEGDWACITLVAPK